MASGVASKMSKQVLLTKFRSAHPTHSKVNILLLPIQYMSALLLIKAQGIKINKILILFPFCL